MKNHRIVLAISIAVASLGLASCGSDPSDSSGPGGPTETVTSNKISGSVEEWAVNVSAQKAQAGEVIFAVANFGSIPHEFLVTKTSYEPGMIPLGDNDRFDEQDKGITVVDEIPEWSVNDAKVLKVDLEVGMYELLCNIAGHYGAGMHTSLEVVASTSPATTEAPKVVSNDVTGSVSEWDVTVSASEAKAGDVSFTIDNAGTIPHEFLVVKTDYEVGKIPLGTNNRFDEEGEGLSVINEIPEWAPKSTGTLTVKLEPGAYQLLCNIEGHYAAGMYAAFTVSS
jgi:uncharacterized cupredoxin-like copper-binding protein